MKETKENLKKSFLVLEQEERSLFSHALNEVLVHFPTDTKVKCVSDDCTTLKDRCLLCRLYYDILLVVVALAELEREGGG